MENNKATLDQLWQTIQEFKNKLTQEEACYKTDGVLTVRDTVIDVRSAKSKKALIVYVGALLEYRRIWAEAADFLGLSEPTPAEVQGLNVEDVLHDCKVRARILDMAGRKAEIAELEKQFNEIAPPDYLREKSLIDLQARLNKLSPK